MEKTIREIRQNRMRIGYRRVHVLLEREGWTIKKKKTYRIHLELRMQQRNKMLRRRVKAKLRNDPNEAIGANEIWAKAFVHG